MKLCNGRCTNMNHEDGTKTLITVESFECERYAVLAGKITSPPRFNSAFQASESQPQHIVGEGLRKTEIFLNNTDDRRK